MTTIKVGLGLVALAAISACSGSSQSDSVPPAAAPSAIEVSDLAPASDPANMDGWVLNEAVSDEFEGDAIDHDKWLVQGHEGNYYIWKGRAPSQFVPHNVIVEDGMLKLRTQWEPDYAFAQENYADGNHDLGYGIYEGESMPVTTAAVVSKKRFLNGYLEVRSKAGDAAMTSSFWAIGHQQELDIYEQMGNPKIKGSITENKFKATVHDWSPPAVRPTRVFGYSEELPFRVADGFHTYGAEWGVDYLKLYIDGELVHHVTQDEIGGHFVINNPMEIWLDSEIFVWLGLPHEEELPVDFEIDYVRVWQQPSDNILNEHRAFYGFEGPFLNQDARRPFEMLPEDVDTNDYQKFWIIPDEDKEQFLITKRRWFTGVNSLKYQTRSGQGGTIITAPEATINLPAGTYELSFKIWLNHGYQPENLHFRLKSPVVEIEPFAISEAEQGKWITLSKTFTKPTDSSPADHMEIEILADDIPAGARDFYIDDVTIVAVD